MLTRKGNESKVDLMACTAPALASMMKIPMIRFPYHLRQALRNDLKENFTFPSDTYNDYVKCIKSLSNVQKLGQLDYFAILKICLYLEQYEVDLLLERHKLLNHKIERSSLNKCFVIRMPSSISDNSVIKPDDNVTLFETVTRQTILAKVVKVVEKDIKIQISSPQEAAICGDQSRRFNINFHSTHWPMRCCHSALMLMSHRRWVEIIYPKLKTNCTDMEFDIEWINKNIEKNEEQKQAVRKILNRTAYPAPYIIFGPPGTGKTATLVETICQILRQFPTKNILVCAVSNAAADEIARRLIKNIPKNLIYRMYAPSRKWSSVDKKIQPCSNFVEDTTLFLSKELLVLKKVIISTLVSATRLLGVNLRENHFSYIIIDEASQAIEPEMLIPLAVTHKKSEDESTRFQAQIVIAGDPYQLGPVIQSRRIEHLLGRTMLERLMEDCVPYKKREDGKYNPNYITKLVRNYRSHENLLHVSNKQFYDNELIICGGPDTQMALNWSKLPNKNFPMIFQEVLGTEERSASRSVCNTAEVLAVIAYVNILMNTKFGKRPLTPKDIGIITPFRQQQLDIAQRLAGMDLKDITVGTVEIFQGQERKVIILSTVRSKIFEHDGKEHIGFLSNAKRFNVAMTRAKALTIIIGNPNVLSYNEHWKVLWEYCEEHNGCIPFEQCPFKANIITKLNSNKVVSNYKAYKNNDASNAKIVHSVKLGKKEKETETLSDVSMCKIENLTLN